MPVAPPCPSSPLTQPRILLRGVVVGRVRYLRAEDVSNLIRDMAASEETDVRRRLEKLAAELLGVGA